MSNEEVKKNYNVNIRNYEKMNMVLINALIHRSSTKQLFWNISLRLKEKSVVESF